MAPRPKNPPPDRRAEILEAALRTFAEKGYAATTNADIARAAGVTPAALYYYFPSKEELFRAALSERRGHLGPAVHGLLTQENLTALPTREVIPMILRTMIAFFTQERTQAVLRIILTEGARAPSILRLWEETIISVAMPVFPYLLEEMEQGRIRRMDPRLFMLTLMGPVIAAVLTRDLLKLPMVQDITNEALVETLVQTTLAGLLTGPIEGIEPTEPRDRTN